ncbi:MAG: OmpA family protein [Gemmatimonadales bacterium]
MIKSALLVLLPAGALAAAGTAVPRASEVLRVGINGHEETARAVAVHRTAAGTISITLLLDEFPVASNIRAREAAGDAAASAGAVAGAAVAGPTTGRSAARVAEDAVEVVRRFREARNVGVWVARGENDIHSMLECPRATVAGARLAGGAVLQLDCLEPLVQTGAFEWRGWIRDSAPPPPVVAEFTPGSAELSAATLERLARLVVALQRHPDFELLIGVVVDSTESEPERLSRARAAALRRGFVDRGVAGERVHPVSYGTERPFGLAGNDQAWSSNRNAMLVILSGAVSP